MRLLEALKTVKEFAIQNVDQISEYLKTKRLLTDELIKTFELGFYPLHGQVPINQKWLDYHKIICRDNNNQKRCPYEGRLLFPIYNPYSELVTLQARILDGIVDPALERYNTRKYWASTFDKSKVLYNLEKAIPYIRKNGKVIITEGQFDVITAWKFGIKNCICTSGTVFNRHHALILSRYAKEVLVIFDSDMGGEKARLKLAQQEFPGLKLRFLTLSNANEKIDLDIYLNRFGRQALVKLIKESDKADILNSFSYKKK